MKVSWLSKYKSKLCCIFCGISNSIVIDFHHIEPKKKKSNISSLKRKDQIIGEASQCVPVCANCHRKIHNGVILCPLKTPK